MKKRITKKRKILKIRKNSTPDILNKLEGLIGKIVKVHTKFSTITGELKTSARHGRIYHVEIFNSREENSKVVFTSDNIVFIQYINEITIN